MPGLVRHWASMHVSMHLPDNVLVYTKSRVYRPDKGLMGTVSLVGQHDCAQIPSHTNHKVG